MTSSETVHPGADRPAAPPKKGGVLKWFVGGTFLIIVLAVLIMAIPTGGAINFRKISNTVDRPRVVVDGRVVPSQRGVPVPAEEFLIRE